MVKAALSMAGIILAGIALYFANEWRACRALAQDYRNFAIGVMADQNLRATVGTPELDRLLDRKGDLAVARAGQTLFELGDRCGQRAADNAQAEAQAMILGISSR